MYALLAVLGTQSLNLSLKIVDLLGRCEILLTVACEE